MWTNGQRLERHEVEHWISTAFPYQHFLARVEEREEPERQLIRVIITVTGPNGEPLVAKDKSSVYYSTRPMVGMPQLSEDWTV